MGGFPAARITDTTAHGGKVVVGFPTVLIGNLPASRIGDMHVCPMVTGIVPHVGGPFVLGAFNVLVGFVPQSRVTDLLVCVGPPDVLAMGQPNVLVGMMGAMGMFGLVMGGLLAGLGNMVGGYPRSVVDSDGNVVTEYNSQITVKGSPEYQATVISDLNKFLSSPTGQRWAAAYAKTGKNMTIEPIPANQQQNNAFTSRVPPGNPDAANGKGCDSVITYNPSLTSEYKAADGSTQPMPPDQTLGHEMIHGLHNGEGTNLQANNQPLPYGNEEESQTIGVNGHDNDDITEKTMQADNGQSNRPDHDSITHDTWQGSDGSWNDVSYDDHGNQTSGSSIPAPIGGRPNN